MATDERRYVAGHASDWQVIADARRLRALGLFVAEGRKVVARVLAEDRDPSYEVVRVLATPPAVDALHLEGRLSDRIDVRPPAALEALTGFNFHRGLIALVRRPRPLPLSSFLAALDERAPLVVGERLVDVDNVGSVFRNARALGAAGVLLDATCADPLYRKAVRTSMGAVLDMPWTMADRVAVWEALRAADYRLIALTPAASAVSLREVLAGGRREKVAFLVGNEGDGLSAAALEASDVRARIPMTPGADSLNVATALAIALYETAARR